MIRNHPKILDVFDLARNLRADDRRELFLGTGQSDASQSIRDAIAASSICEAVRFNDGALAAIWGVVPLEGLGSIWMLTSDRVESRPSQFLRVCPGLVQYAHTEFSTLICAPWRGNALHLRWLRWLGFTPGQVVGHFQIHNHVRTTCCTNTDAGRIGGKCDGAEECI